MIKPVELRIGANIDIVFETDLTKNNAHFMKALVYDYEGNIIITSQTSPALSSYFLNRRIALTFLVNRDNRVLRYGFPALLKDLIKNYQISSSNSVEALVVEQFAQPEPLDFRTYFRVKTTPSGNISLDLKEGRVRLMDISLGGAKFACPKDFLLRPADKIDVKLTVGRTVFKLNALVCNVKTPFDSALGAKNVQHISIQFESTDSQMETALGRAIIEMERKLLSEGKI